MWKWVGGWGVFWQRPTVQQRSVQQAGKPGQGDQNWFDGWGGANRGIVSFFFSVRRRSFIGFFICSFFSFIFISWRLITLQYCSGFCHTLTWISHGYTCIPHPDPLSHLPLYPIPLGLPSDQARALVSCIQPGLVICFTLDNIHVSMLFSWTIPPSPSPTESKSPTEVFKLRELPHSYIVLLVN